ncbi:hypothetical protein FWF48_00180 [Candidatus Saccharibacteria bacterium]|nr:hypothetical protein [Candidatus Saccharibacteria bacterium]
MSKTPATTPEETTATTEEVPTARVTMLGEETVTVELHDGMTVSEATEAAGYDLGELKIHAVTINGAETAMDTLAKAVVQPNDAIVLTSKVNNG